MSFKTLHCKGKIAVCSRLAPGVVANLTTGGQNLGKRKTNNHERPFSRKKEKFLTFKFSGASKLVQRKFLKTRPKKKVLCYFFPVRISEVNCEDNQREKKECNKKFLAQKSDSCVEVEKSEVKVSIPQPSCI